MQIGKETKISDINASPLIGRAFKTRDNNESCEVVVLWHRALGNTWPADQDTIAYCYTIDGNEAPVHQTEFAEFYLRWKLPSLDELQSIFARISIDQARLIL